MAQGRKSKRLKIKYWRETGILDHIPEDPPLREVLKTLRMEIGTRIRSYRQIDGVIRDSYEIYDIRCLMKAIRLLQQKK